METGVGEVVDELGDRYDPGIGGDDGSIIVQDKRKKEIRARPARRTVLSQSGITRALGSGGSRLYVDKTRRVGEIIGVEGRGNLPEFGEGGHWLSGASGAICTPTSLEAVAFPDGPVPEVSMSKGILAGREDMACTQTKIKRAQT